MSQLTCTLHYPLSLSVIPLSLKTHAIHYVVSFKKLERLISSTNLQWWDKFFLEKYLLARISSRGLRVLKTCSFLDLEHCKEWENISELCTSKWIKVLITHRHSKYEQLTHQVQMLCQEIENISSHVPLSWFNILKGILRDERTTS